MTKRIWHLCSNRWNSAVTEYCLSAARSINLSGGQSLLTALEGKPCHLRGESIGLDCKSVESFKLASLWQLKAIEREFKPDVIIVYGGQETFLARFLTSAPVIRFRGLDRDLTAPPGKLSYRLSQGHLSAVIAPSSTLARSYQALSQNLAAIPLGIDTDKFQYLPEKTGGQRPTLVILGRLDPVKGHGAFFLWFRMLQKIWPEHLEKPFLKVIGEAANIPAQQIRAFASDALLVEGKDWQLIDKRVKDIAQVLSNAHLGVIPSQGSEVICRVAEEFLLCGTPVFVSGVGSLEDCLYDEDAGVSYRALEGDQAVKLMKDLLLKSFAEDEDDKKQRSQRSQEHFSFAAMGRSLMNFISEIS